MTFRPFNPHDDVHIHKQNLPHWRQWGTTYFVTARLGDSLPADLLEQWRTRRDTWLRAHKINRVHDLDQLTEQQRHEYHREFTAKFHELLDAGYGSCLLAAPTLTDILADKLTQGDGIKYQLDAWVIMPNHLHALVEPDSKIILGSILQHWKGGSARAINLAIERTGTLWQVESFDHIVRSEAQLQHFRHYIFMNPEKAGLRSGFRIGIGKESGLSANEALLRLGLGSETK